MTDEDNAEWERITGQLDEKTKLDLLDSYTSTEEKLEFIKQYKADDNAEEEP